MMNVNTLSLFEFLKDIGISCAWEVIPAQIGMLAQPRLDFQHLGVGFKLPNFHELNIIIVKLLCICFQTTSSTMHIISRHFPFNFQIRPQMSSIRIVIPPQHLQPF